VSLPDLGAVWPWATLALLGAFHGANPAMGWLFAVALGFQQKSRRAVVRALLPIAIGHEGAIGLVVVLVSGFQLLASPDVLRIVGAAALIAFGAYKLLRPRSHPRWVGMQLSLFDLVVWSFLMSTAHGAGLMLVPVLLGLPAATAQYDFLPSGLGAMTVVQDAAAVLIHTLAMLVVMAAVALLVYDRLGVAVLRRAWLNLDLVWGAAVVGAGVATLFS